MNGDWRTIIRILGRIQRFVLKKKGRRIVKNYLTFYIINNEVKLSKHRIYTCYITFIWCLQPFTDLHVVLVILLYLLLVTNIV